MRLRPAPQQSVEQLEYTAETAEAAVKAGEVPVALIIPHGFGENAISLPVADTAAERQQRHDCAALVTGLLQKVAMTSMPDVMAELGSKYMDQYAGVHIRTTQAHGCQPRAVAQAAGGREQ